MKLCLFFIKCLVFSYLHFSFLLSPLYGEETISDRVEGLKSKLFKRAGLYANLCYRSDTSLQDGTTIKARGRYFREIKQGIDERVRGFKRLGNLNALESTLIAMANAYSDSAILSCAKRNFLYLSDIEKKWFDFLNRSGVEAENYEKAAPRLSEGMRKKLMESDLVFVGNNHYVADLHGEILFQLKDYLDEGKRRVIGLMVEHTNHSFFSAIYRRFRQSDAKKDFDALFQSETALPYLNHPAHRLLVQEDKVFLAVADIPRLKINCLWASLCPNTEIEGIVRGDVKEPEINFLHLKNQIERLTTDTVWLAYLGELHTLRFQGSNESQIERAIRLQDRALRTFVVSQFGGETDTIIRRSGEIIKDSDKLVRGLFVKFSFPFPQIDSPSIESGESGEGEPFIYHWKVLIEKYNAFGNRHTRPIYVDWVRVLDGGALAFNQNRVYADLQIIHPSTNMDSYDIEKDEAYLYLKRHLEGI